MIMKMFVLSVVRFLLTSTIWLQQADYFTIKVTKLLVVCLNEHNQIPSTSIYSMYVCTNTHNKDKLALASISDPVVLFL